MSVPIEHDAAYWRKMYEERIATEDAGFAALLAERDRYREALDFIANNALKDYEYVDLAREALNGEARG